ncbi:MAG: hypothetical protein IKT67_00045, partial [Lachnospiraceae bacterium]|nr:hypothetical protein [Lachnospiraceae bacterium]
APNQKNLVMYIYFADSTKLRIDKSPLDNLGLIYDLFEKYDITYEENEDWKTFRDWVFDAEPGADRYFETKHEESSEEVLKKGTNIICKICGMSNKGTDKICSFCRAVLDENRP